MKDSPLSNLLRQANTKTENQLIAFYDYSWKGFTDTGISTGEYMIFYQGGIIDHGIHVTVPFYKSSAESEYNSA